jgi:hypothetical protein
MDSNILIDYLGNKFVGVAEQRLSGIFDDSFYYSIISRKEELGYNAPGEVLAATSLVHRHTLLTRNTNDFKKIPSLQIDNPWQWK